MTASLRGEWRWTPAQDLRLYRRRRIERAPFKTLAHEFGRSEATVAKRFHEIEAIIEREFRPILEQHRMEELQLYERLLAEKAGVLL